jgi:hypothetical protein
LVGWDAGTKIQASDLQASDEFGYSVAMSSDGTKVIVGAYLEDTGYTSAGAAYIFALSGGSWSQEAKIQASDLQASDYFGRIVSMSGDGTKVIMGAHTEDTGGTNTGAAYIFALSGGSWSQEAKIQASDKQTQDFFGRSVSMSGDGTKVIVGANGEDTGASNAGSIYIFALSGGSWSQEAKIQASDKQADDYFGYSVAMNSDGTKAIVGASIEDTGGSNAGKVYIYTYSSGSWGSEVMLQSSDIQADDQFGRSVSMSSDGTKVIVGAHLEDTGGSNAGSAYIFALSGGSWSQEAKIQASDKQADDQFGTSVSMSSDGTKVLVGANYEDTGGGGAGAAYIYTYDGSTWGSEVKIQASDIQANDEFGASVSMSGDGTKVIGGAKYEDTGGSLAGSAYIFAYQANQIFDTSTQVFTATGTGIVSGSTVQLEGADGTLYSVFNTTTPNAAGTQVTFKMGTLGASGGYAVAQQPYKLKVNSTSGLIGTSTAAIGFATGWTTAAGANLEFNTNATTTQTLAGTDGGGGTNRTFSLAPGSNALPSPLVLTGSTGAITGTIAAVGTTSVTFRLTDNATGLFTDRAINIVGVDALYSFSPNPFTFTNAGQTGRLGPTLATLTGHADYSSAAWRTNTAYFKLGAPSPSPTTYPLRLNGFQLWTVPLNATYKIIAKGARGGSSIGTEDGYGGQIEARFTLTKGTKIIIVVGQEGATPGDASGGGGGGGATFILKDNFSVSSSNPYMGSDLSDIYMIVGGGGGGTSDAHSTPGRAGDAEMYSSGGAIGGTGAASYGGGGGTGYTTSGGGMSNSGKASGGGVLASTTQFFGFPGGESWTSGSYGLQDGGFGGGGAAVHHEGAAGGGYQGGSCGTFQSTNPDAGGHTFVSSTATYTGSHTTHTDQHGSVQITKM